MVQVAAEQVAIVHQFPGEASGGGASAESLSPVSGATVYPVVVGAGGAGTTSDGARGSVSSFNGVVSTGGGGGSFVGP